MAFFGYHAVIMDREKRILEIENRLGLALVVALFFPAFLIFIEVKDTSAAQWSALAALYLIAYILFEIFKGRINDSLLQWIDGSLLAGIGFFIQPILLFSTDLNAKVSWLTYSSLIFSLWMLPAIALFVVILIVIGLIIGNKK